MTVRATVEERKDAAIQRAAIQQVEVATAGSIRELARTQLTHSLNHLDELRSLWAEVAPQLRDEDGKVRRVVDEDGNVSTALLRELLLVSKALREAGGADAFKWAELAAKIEGDLQTGTQLNIQVNAILTPIITTLGREAGAWLDEDLATADREWLAGLGLSGEAVEQAMADRRALLGAARERLIGRVEKAVAVDGAISK